ncbi:hypothetical protein MHU86_13006 [Fragilaria crotonensis]|nr:hypothetical protein MHU86_13006 [Fragilaria crotonensis]
MMFLLSSFVLPMAVRRCIVITFLVLFPTLLHSIDPSEDSRIAESGSQSTTTDSAGSSSDNGANLLASDHHQQQQQQQQQCLQLQMTWPPIGTFQLNDGALDVLKYGNPYETVVSIGNNHGENEEQKQHLNMVVQDVQAPPSIIWEHIVDYFDSYSTDELHDDAKDTIVESTSNNGSQTMFTRLRLKNNMDADSLSDTLFLQHSYNPTLGSLISWSVIDLEAQQQLQEEDEPNSNAATTIHVPSSYTYCGYWYVVAVPQTPPTIPLTRVHHSVHVGIAPGNENKEQTANEEEEQQQMAVAQYLSSHKASIETMEWVKTRSEEKHGNDEGMKQETLVDTSSVIHDSDDGVSHSDNDIKVHENDETCDSAPTEYSEPTNDATTKTAPADIEITKQVGLTRYAMLASIVVLSLYNVHLYFSQ